MPPLPRAGLQGSHPPDEGVSNPPLPPLGEAPPRRCSPLTEVVLVALVVLSWVPSEAEAGLVDMAVELVLSSPEGTRWCGELWGSGGGVQSECRTTVCQSLEPGERACWPPRHSSFSTSAASTACGGDRQWKCPTGSRNSPTHQTLLFTGRLWKHQKKDPAHILLCGFCSNYERYSFSSRSSLRGRLGHLFPNQSQTKVCLLFKASGVNHQLISSPNRQRPSRTSDPRGPVEP